VSGIHNRGRVFSSIIELGKPYIHMENEIAHISHNIYTLLQWIMDLNAQ
jgi:hypothetical protein